MWYRVHLSKACKYLKLSSYWDLHTIQLNLLLVLGLVFCRSTNILIRKLHVTKRPFYLCRYIISFCIRFKSVKNQRAWSIKKKGRMRWRTELSFLSKSNISQMFSHSAQQSEINLQLTPPGVAWRNFQHLHS